jgi:hypothetical protein
MAESAFLSVYPSSRWPGWSQGLMALVLPRGRQGANSAGWNGLMNTPVTSSQLIPSGSGIVNGTVKGSSGDANSDRRHGITATVLLSVLQRQ